MDFDSKNLKMGKKKAENICTTFSGMCMHHRMGVEVEHNVNCC